jgi:hypothetical protein
LLREVTTLLPTITVSLRRMPTLAGFSDAVRGKAFEDVQIGEHCLIGGAVANWTRVEHDVTFMGVVAHTYRQPEAITAWNISPVVSDPPVVGEEALLIGGNSHW